MNRPIHPLMPYKLKRLARHFGQDGEFALLDVGCGNHSATRTKRWFPRCEYHGVDRGAYNNDEADFAAMTAYYQADLAADPGALDSIGDAAFDAIIVAHVIEHLPNGLEIVRRLAGKLRDGGRIYIEYPGQRSLGLPSMRGTLNFCDDYTHVRVYGVAEVANALLDQRCRILRAGTRRDWARIAIAPANFLYQWLRDGAPSAVTLWDVLGFAEYVYAERRPRAAAGGGAD